MKLHAINQKGFFVESTMFVTLSDKTKKHVYTEIQENVLTSIADVLQKHINNGTPIDFNSIGNPTVYLKASEIASGKDMNYVKNEMVDLRKKDYDFDLKESVTTTGLFHAITMEFGSDFIGFEITNVEFFQILKNELWN